MTQPRLSRKEFDMSDIQNAETTIHDGGAAPSSQAAPKAPLWQATPELDVYESPERYRILANVPGASSESVDVQVVGTTVHIRAEQAPSTRHADVARLAFERHLELPSEVDPSSASAQLRNGVLEIDIQKSAAARRIKIPVNAN
jgi:HSP20 family protein